MWLTDITVYAKFYNINASLSDLKYQVEGVLLSMCRGLLRIRKHTMCFFRLIRRRMQPSL